MPAKRLKPPRDVTGAALYEWNRTVRAIKRLGREVKPADESLLTIYVQTWQTNQDAYEKVRKVGSVIRGTNGSPCRSPFYSVWIDTGKRLTEMQAALGLTPAARKFDAGDEDDDQPSLVDLMRKTKEERGRS